LSRKPANLKVTEEVLDEIVKLYLRGYKAGEILKQIKSKYDISIGKSTFYRNLKKRIKLRSISETLKIQNRTNLPINEIIRLYVEEKYSIKKLAEKFSRSWHTIRKILIENNVKLKDRGEINHLFRTKFVKPKVSLTECEKAYIAGLIIGDFAVYKKSKYTLRITTGSTKQDFINMLVKVFEKYGHIIQTFDKYNNSQKITVDLDLESFKFLIDIKKNYKFLKGTNKEFFFYFLAGFIDAEGSISIYKKQSCNEIGFAIQIYNTDLEILKIIKSKLEAFGFHPNITKVREIGKDMYKNKIFNHNYEEFRLSLCRKSEIKMLLELLPLKHSEKLSKKELMLYLIKNNIRKLNDLLEIINHQPLQFPIGKSRTTRFDRPAECTASTTESKSL
jgi:transposase